MAGEGGKPVMSDNCANLCLAQCTACGAVTSGGPGTTGCDSPQLARDASDAYLVANVTPVAALAMIAATACGWDT